MNGSRKPRWPFYCAVLVGTITALFLGWRWVRQVPEPPPYPPHETDPLRSSAPTTEQAESIRIALISPETGRPPGTPPLMANAVKFAVSRMNRLGGIGGTPVELLTFDNRGTPIGAQQAARQAILKDVSAVIGGWYSSNAMAMARILQTAGIPMIATGASNPDVTRIGNCIFRVQFVDSFQGAVMAEYAFRMLGARKAVVLVNIENKYSPYLGDVFSEQFRQFGGEILNRGEFLGKDTDFSYLIPPFRELSPDVIYLPAYDKESTAIMGLVRDAGITATFLGADGWVPEMIDHGGEAVRGALYTKAWHPDATQIQGLLDVYKEWVQTNGPVKRDVTVLSLDACHLLFAAIRAAVTPTPENIRNALARTKNFRGIAGTYSFDLNGDPIKPIQIVQLAAPRPKLVGSIEPRSVKLGVIFATSGDAALTNVMGFEAARFAADKINRMGGILANTVELLEYDNQSTAAGSRRAAETAVADGVVAVIGPSHSSHALAMAPIFQRAGIPMVTPTATNPKVTRERDFVFRTCFTDRLQGRVLAEFALKQLRARTAVVMTNTDSEYSVDLARFFIERFNKDGRVLAELDYLENSVDFSDPLRAVAHYGPHVVFVPGYPRDSAYILRQAHDLGISAIFLGGDAWDEMMYDYTRIGLDGNYYAGHWHADLPNPRSLRFVTEYAKSHPLHRTGLVALTYDTVNLIADAIRRAGVFHPSEIRKALAATKDFQGITGMIRFDENGDPVKPVMILKFSKGAGVFHSMVTPE